MSSGFWKPGTSGPGGLDRGEDDAAQLVNPKLSNLPLNTQRQSLPIYRHRNSLLFALQKYRATVLVGETGCGKTTQVSVSYSYVRRTSCHLVVTRARHRLHPTPFCVAPTAVVCSCLLHTH